MTNYRANIINNAILKTELKKLLQTQDEIKQLTY